jgi:hypothetical protein
MLFASIASDNILSRRLSHKRFNASALWTFPARRASMFDKLNQWSHSSVPSDSLTHPSRFAHREAAYPSAATKTALPPLPHKPNQTLDDLHRVQCSVRPTQAML